MFSYQRSLVGDDPPSFYRTSDDTDTDTITSTVLRGETRDSMGDLDAGDRLAAWVQSTSSMDAYQYER